MDKYICNFFGFFDDILAKIDRVFSSKKTKRKKINVKIVIVNAIVKMICIYIIMTKIYAPVRFANVRRTKRRNKTL